MLELLRRLKPLEQDAKITEGVARLASKEREVRSLELLIEYISSIDDKELARLWPRLVTAVYCSQTPGIAARITKSAPPDDDSLSLEG